MNLERLSPSNFPTTYVRVVAANGIAYFTDHVARPEFVTFREQFGAILARYDELFEQFGYEKKNIVFALMYLDNAYTQSDCADLWQAWIGDIATHVIWVPSKFYTDRRAAITFFVATDEASAAKARQDPDWFDDVNDMFSMSGDAPRLTVHNGVAYLIGSACMDGSPIQAQSKAALDQIDEMMCKHNLKRENLVQHFSYVSDRPEVDIDAYEAEWHRWVGTEYPPSGVRIQTYIPKGHEVEISILVAVPDDYAYRQSRYAPEK